MAGVTPWLVSATVLLPALAAAVLMCARGRLGQRLAAVQVATALAILLLAIMTFAFEEASSMDLALTLALLSLPATLLYAVFLERWL